MKVSLLFTQTGMDNANFGVQKFRDQNIGIIPPVSLLNVASILEKIDVEVSIIDVDAENLSYPKVLRRISEFSPDLIGFSISTYNFQEVLGWIKRVKEDTHTPIIAGGPHVTIYSEEVMSHKFIDYGIIGEAELPLPEFIKAFRKDKNFKGIKSVAYRENGELFIDKTRQFIDDIEGITYARHLIANERYSNILTRRRNFTAMLSARGCPYRCTFCDLKNPPYRHRSAANFVNEIRENLETHNIREFDIYDSTFTANRKRVLEICALIVEQGLDVGWTIRSRVDSVNEEMIHALKNAGCHTIFYGVESSNPEILKVMKKNIEISRIKHIVNYTKNVVGIDTLGYFLFGYPGETKKTIEETIEFALELPLDYAQFGVLIPFPETEIYDYYLERGMGDFWKENTLNPDNDRVIELVDVTLSRAEMDEYCIIANRKFYSRPKNILHKLKNVRSLDNFMRLSRGGVSVFRNLVGI